MHIQIYVIYFYFLDVNSSKCSSPVSRSDSIYRSDSSLATTVSSIKSIDSMKSLANQVVAYHFCQADNAPTCLVPEFIHSIAAQMSQSPYLTPYYQYILSDSNIQSILSLAGCVSNPSGALIQGILEPLNSLRRLGRLSGQTCIILIGEQIVCSKNFVLILVFSEIFLFFPIFCILALFPQNLFMVLH